MGQLREIRYVSGGWFLFIDGVKTGTPLTDNDIRWNGANKVILDGSVMSAPVNARASTDTYIIRSTLAQSITIADTLVRAGEVNILKFEDGVVVTVLTRTATNVVITLDTGAVITVSALDTTQFQIGNGAPQAAAEFVKAHISGFTAGVNAEPVVSIAGAQTLTIIENTNTSAANTGFSVSATDVDNDIVTFSIDDVRFEIVNGVVRVKAGQRFDFETDNGKTITITGTDTGADTLTHTQTFTLGVRDINEAPKLMRAQIAANINETVILSAADLLVTDADIGDGAADLTYTITDAAASTGVLEKFNAATKKWAILVNNNTFTQADVNDWQIRFVANDGTDSSDPAFSFSVADGGEDAIAPIVVTLETGIRAAQAFTNVAGANSVNLATQTVAKIIATGDGKDVIIAGKGNDLIDAGLGDDKVDLSAGGADNVVYDFGAGGVGLDGGDKITGFKRGEDKLIFKEATQSSSSATTLAEFFTNARGANLNILNDDYFIVTPDYYANDEREFFITGITFNFQDSGVYDSNKISSGLLAIIFDTRIPWDDFLTLIGGPDAMDIGLFALKDPATIVDILGEDSFGFAQIVTATPDHVTTGAVTIEYAETHAPAAKPNVGETLTAITTDLNDVDDETLTFTYQWKLNGADIAGATDATHIIVATGDYTVTVIVRDSMYNVQTPITSTSFTVTDSVTTGTVTITHIESSNPTDAPNIGETLTAVTTDLTDADDDALTFTYQWQLDGADISGATAKTYTSTEKGAYTVAVRAHDSVHNVVSDPFTSEAFAVFVPTIITLSDYTKFQIVTGGAADTLNGAGKTSKQLIQGGNLGDTITASGHGDTVAGGYGADGITLGAGADIVAYQFDSGHAGGWQATDGADLINNFKRGTDQFVLFDTKADSPIVTLAAFLAGAKGADGAIYSGTGIDDDQVQFTLGFDPTKSLWTGLRIDFKIAGTNDGKNGNAGSSININFDASAQLTNADAIRIFGGTRADWLGAIQKTDEQNYKIIAKFEVIEKLLGGTDSFNSLLVADDAVLALGFNVLSSSTKPATLATTKVTEDEPTGKAIGEFIAQADSGNTITGYEVLTSGIYGTLTLGTNGKWTYVVDNSNAAVDALNAGQSITDTVIIRATQSDDETNDHIITVTINGRMDIIGDGGDNRLGEYRYITDGIIQGGLGRDTILSGAGNDIIIGGLGQDTINLGNGEATVIHRFSSSGSQWTQTDSGDVITNFKRGKDKLLLVDVDAASPINNVEDFITEFANSGGELRIDIDVATDVIVHWRLWLPINGSDQYHSVTVTFSTDDAAHALTYSDISDKFRAGKKDIPTEKVLTDLTFLDDLLGVGGLEIIASSDINIDII